MNKNLIVIGALSLVVLTLGLVGYAFAQGQPPSQSDYPYGPDMMNAYGDYHDEIMGNGYGMMGYGMMGWHGEEHEAMIESLAESLGISPEEIDARHDGGESLWEIAEGEGLSYEEIRVLMFSAHDTAFEDAVDKGWLTQEQADWMDGHMNQMWDGELDHCGGMSWDESGTRWHGMGW